MRIFPNPATTKDAITVFLDDDLCGKVQIELLDRLGYCVYRQFCYLEENCSTFQIDPVSVPAGIYQLRLEHGGKTGIQWLMIR